MLNIKRRTVTTPVSLVGAIQECGRELNMRVRVWSKAATQPISFMSLKQNRYYEVLQTVFDVLSVMTPQEWERLKQRKAEVDALRVEDERKQQKLF